MPQEPSRWEPLTPAEDVEDMRLIENIEAENARTDDPLSPAIGIVTCLVAGVAVWIGVFFALAFR